MMTKEEKAIEFAEDFEWQINLGKAKAYSKLSQERPLTDSELKEYKSLCKGLGIEVQE